MDEEATFEQIREASVLLCKLTNDSNFEYPNSKDKIFSANSDFWHLNACIDSLSGADAYASGYLQAAKLLGRIVIFSGSNMDTLVYPIVFLYRHYLELKLKSLIRCGLHLTGTAVDEKLEEALANHNLMKLWNQFKPFFKEVSGHSDNFETVEKGMESYINQIHAIDPASSAFRYDHPKRSNGHSLKDLRYINVLQLCQNIEKLTDLLEGVDCEFADALDYVANANY